jgi:hypothetical protein
MTLSDVVVCILIERKQFEDSSAAANEVFQTFRKEFPYWAYSDWNVAVSPLLARMLVQHFSTLETTIPDMILDLPPLVDRFRYAKH